jgi:hypothetical protein
MRNETAGMTPAPAQETESSRLLALAERCEQATEEDRELDAEIAVAVLGGEIVWRQANFTMDSFPTRRYPSRDHIHSFGVGPVEKYTASIDAASTLVPDGCQWDCALTHVGYCATVTEVYPEVVEHFAGAPALANAALALCVAALRARAHIAASSPPSPEDK